MRQISGYQLWVGHVGDIRDLRGVLSAGILAVVDLAINEPPAVLTRELVYCRFPLLDGSGNPAWLLRAAIEVVAGLLKNGTPTLVFCGAGMSRSVCVAAAAITLANALPLTETLTAVALSGPSDVSPGLLTDIQKVVA